MHKIEELLNAALENVYQSDATGAKAPYVVWDEDGQGEVVWADNRMCDRARTGTIDYFTYTDKDEVIIKIENALNDGEIAWKLASRQYEEDTSLYHFEWVWEIWQE